MKNIILVCWVATWFVIGCFAAHLTGCATIATPSSESQIEVVVRPLLPVANETNVLVTGNWPDSVQGCPDYDIATNSDDNKLKFDPNDEIDMLALQTSINSCTQNYGGARPCLKLLYKERDARYVSICGAKHDAK